MPESLEKYLKGLTKEEGDELFEYTCWYDLFEVTSYMLSDKGTRYVRRRQDVAYPWDKSKKFRYASQMK